MKPGQRVVDLGCWPGGWLQEAARVVGRKGRVVGVDRVPIDPPLPDPHVSALVGDLEDADLGQRLRAELGGACDVLLSDAAPKLSGIRERDRALEERLLEAIEALIPTLLTPGGDLLVKLLDCPEAQAFKQRVAERFERVKTPRVRATRKGSSERYLLARGYRGPASDGLGDAAPRE